MSYGTYIKSKTEGTTMSKRVLKNTIKVWGRFHSIFGDTPEDTVKDMLRYDQGVIVEGSVMTSGDDFEMHIISERYTPRRWQSFGICCELIEGTTLANLEEIEYRGAAIK